MPSEVKYDPILLNSIYDLFVKTLGEGEAKQRAMTWAQQIADYRQGGNSAIGSDLKKYFDAILSPANSNAAAAMRLGLRNISRSGEKNIENFRQTLAGSGLSKSAVGVNYLAKLFGEEASAKEKLRYNINLEDQKRREDAATGLLNLEKLNLAGQNNQNNFYTDFLKFLNQKQSLNISEKKAEDKPTDWWKTVGDWVLKIFK